MSLEAERAFLFEIVKMLKIQDLPDGEYKVNRDDPLEDIRVDVHMSLVSCKWVRVSKYTGPLGKRVKAESYRMTLDLWNNLATVRASDCMVKTRDDQNARRYKMEAFDGDGNPAGVKYWILQKLGTAFLKEIVLNEDSLVLVGSS